MDTGYREGALILSVGAIIAVLIGGAMLTAAVMFFHMRGDE